MNIQHDLLEHVSAFFQQQKIPTKYLPKLRPASHPRFGDYQIDGLMQAASAIGQPARELGKTLAERLAQLPYLTSATVAGPGFVNLVLDDRFISSAVFNLIHADNLGIPSKGFGCRPILIDYSAPNIAKEMAVHHLRSTVIGDAMVRTFLLLGYKVIRANHIGDWGTQFGMLLAYIAECKAKAEDPPQTLSQLAQAYQAAKIRYDSDPAFAQAARRQVVELQSGGTEAMRQWKAMVNLTMEENQRLYEELNVTLRPEDTMGESLYNPLLPELIALLKEKGIVVEQDGAMVAFSEQFKNKQGEPFGVVLQKRDGGYLYATTDLACVRYRCEQFAPSRVLYYVDARQKNHLCQVWEIARRAGFIPEETKFEHHAFGMMLDQEGRPFKTRSGEVIRLRDLLDAAYAKASELVHFKSPHLDSIAKQEVTRVLAVGAIKYGDLCKHRTTDYRFNLDQMLSFQGNTAPYIQYAYTRAVSLLKKQPQHMPSLQSFAIHSPYERRLHLQLLQFVPSLEAVAEEGLPHLMCQYLYQLAECFSQFYEHCPVMQACDSSIQRDRQLLCQLVARTLKVGLYSLGINVVEQM